ncbi:Cysteine--tRNA ligase [Candidatus Erwinia haradaeae]|uniref:Cysteine--tRNA ligase n=1 Tax=Candidatus Erwinia haradaeae TaxID=1922217 RepID=A0A451DCY7_9GAMM|nr:cysteine--tRNA ligase [Candidatus Erwinia haradaeae]VFP84262.1 Cysteine--tRNA ligase [Candidatus Erwinia haradaeae]
MLKIFNTLSRAKEEFQPIHTGMVNMYVCGMTAYNLCHIGHGRTFIAFDIIARYLRYIGYQLNYVRNITDIDDKIIQRADNNGQSITCLTKNIIYEMHQDFAKLNILPPNHEPRATWYIAEMVSLIKRLMDREYAYISHDGDVLFSVDRNPTYGLLSRQDLTQLQTSTRLVPVSKNKKNPMDFVLWKRSKIGEPFWPSPWGDGRPGWHIECSAMNYTHLGKHFDIHGGGADLLFPHHENEIAQSTCAYDTPYVNYWMHSGMVNVEQEKMSKSLNNFVTIRTVLESHDAESVRYFLLSSHYRSQLHYNQANLKQARAALGRLYLALYKTDINALVCDEGVEFEIRFCEAMDDDFNTPLACAILFELARKINRKKNTYPQIANSLAVQLRLLGRVLGLLEQDPEKFLKGHGCNVKDYSISQIEELIHIRNIARQKEDWKQADFARHCLYDMGVLLEDTRDGTRWKYK